MILRISPFADGDSPVFCVCKHLEKDHFNNLENDLYIDVTKNSYMQIGTLAILAMLSYKARHMGKTSNGSFNPSSELGRYMQRMNFFEAQGIQIEESFRRQPSRNRFLEITKIDVEANNNDLPAQLRKVVTRQRNIHHSLVDALDLAFGEIVDNVETHAQSKVGGYVAAQYYPRKHYVEFCVVDGGIGIVESLQSNEKYKSIEGSQLLLMAFNDGVGEKVGASYNERGHGGGMGLVIAARLVEASGGSLWVVSHEYAAEISSGERHPISGMFYPGTAICAKIPTSATIRESDILNNDSSSFYVNELAEIYDENLDKTDDILW